MPEAVGQTVASLGQQVPESLAIAGHARQLHQGFGIPPFQGPSHLRFGKVSAVRQFHGTGNRGAHGDRVQPQFVADVVGLGDGRQVVDHAVGAHGIDGFIFRAFAFSGKARDVDLRFSTTADGAAIAGHVFFQEPPGQFLAVDFLPAVKCALLPVFGRQNAEVLRRHGHTGRPVDGQAQGRFLDPFLERIEHLFVEGLEAIRVGQGNPALALDHHGLEVFGAHHRSDAGSAGGPVFVIHDRGKQHPLFPGRPDTGHPGLGIGFGKKHIGGLVGVFSPQMIRLPEFGLSLIDPKVHRLLCPAGKKDRIESGTLEFAGKHAAGIRAGNGAGQRGFGHHHVPGTGGSPGAGQRPGGHHQHILRRQGITSGIDELVQIVNPQSTAADVVFRHGGLHWKSVAFAARQIDSKNFSHPPVHAVSPLR